MSWLNSSVLSRVGEKMVRGSFRCREILWVIWSWKRARLVGESCPMTCDDRFLSDRVRIRSMVLCWLREMVWKV